VSERERERFRDLLIGAAAEDSRRLVERPPEVTVVGTWSSAGATGTTCSDAFDATGY
jgi:hypothetical protein